MLNLVVSILNSRSTWVWVALIILLNAFNVHIEWWQAFLLGMAVALAVRGTVIE